VNSLTISHRRTAIIAALATVLMLVFVRLPLPFLYGIELLLFTTVVWFVHIRYSLQAAVLLAIIGAACGIFLWDQTPLLALTPIEILLVGWASARSNRSVVFWDAIYWVTLGISSHYFLYVWLTHSSDTNTTLVLLFAVANGLMNAFFGQLAAEYLPDVEASRMARRWRIGRIAYHLCMGILIIPTLIYLIISGFFNYQGTLGEVSRRLDTIYGHVNEELNNLSVTELRDLQVGSTLQKAALHNMFANLTTNLDIQLTLIDDRSQVIATLDPSLASSREMYDWRSGGTVDQLADNLYLRKPDDIPAYNKVYRWSQSNFVSIYHFDRLPYTLIAIQPVTIFQQLMYQLYLLSIVIVGISTIISAAVAYRITRRLSQSITELGEFTTGLPQRIRSREPIDWRDSPLHEVNLLRNNFEDMSRELSSMFYEINQSEEKLRKLAHYDTLTSLGNRYSFGLYLPSLIQMAKERSLRVACLFIDLDFFKSINDTHGHDAGDAVLKEVGARLNLYNTEQMKAFRLSGDEFVVVVSEPLPEDLEQWAQEIHDELIRTDVSFHGQRIPIRLSAGISLYPDHGQDAESLLRSSDHAMYRAKVSGRNRVRLGSKIVSDGKEGEWR